MKCILPDAVLYAMKVVARFYKVQFEHVKLRCDVLFASDSLGYVLAKHWHN